MWGRSGVMWGWDPQVVVLEWRQIRAVGRRGLWGAIGQCGVMWGGCGVMWGAVGLGPLSGRPVMEADKGCGVEVVVGQKWGEVGWMWGWEPQGVVL